MKPDIAVIDEINSACRLGEVRVDDLAVGPSSPALLARMSEQSQMLRATYGGAGVGRIDRVQAVRTMYRQLHMDPHHTRPSSEALLRRVFRGEDLPCVNCIVDAANLWSVSTLCPVGLYDAARISGPVALRFGQKGEGYEGIRRDWINVSDRPGLFDDKGPFGNPTGDSLRTAVTESTIDVLAVAFQPHEFPAIEVADLEAAIRASQVNDLIPQRAVEPESVNQDDVHAPY
jgi:DNA/RNA-binding domain of Phe-tRNA-synthetase-like protein